jgi:acetyltransferase-like isoleucine patch superfamily enzyme
LTHRHPFELAAAARRASLRTLQRHRFGAIGRGTTYDPTTSTISHPENFFLGRNIFIGGHAVMSAVDVPVVIGDDTIIGPGLCLISGNHRYDLPGVAFRAIERGDNAPITIGRNVWIGARVIVLRGVTIGDAAVIGAGSVVTRDVEPFAVAVGSPARRIRWRFEGADRERHQSFIDRELRLPEIGRRRV